ncbi:MCE family protein [Nocardioides sp.]|uniref:MCE family protein n=1 Tax=Nocardioides sp. TaxID=35761 RepID=UPI001A1EDE7F|nr:MCE family protein [Nocardioides sp.]MBJ7359728.1 MCE family protein [Nocardioides sp.]
MNLVLRQHKALGVVFLALVVLSGYLTYAVFTKQFSDYDEVTLKTSKIGLQLPVRADVKIRGVIVGEVLETRADADGAEVVLGLFQDHTDSVPADVTGSIVPKTLFGEKYVSLIPASDSSEPIQPGATIERTQVATEVEEVLSDLYPLLRTVQPAELNMTLNAIATALEGRGDQLGDNLETVDSYLKRLNPQIPALIEDLRLTAQVSDIYADVLPEVGTILQNTVTTTGTLEDREAQLNALFTNVSNFSDSARTFLDDNEANLIRLGEVSRAQLRVLARYSTEFPCLLKGIVNAGELQAEAFRGFTLHIVLETLPNQPRPYGPEDRPELGEDRGPSCINLPNPPGSQANPVRRQPDFKDGVDEPTGKGTQRTGTGYTGLDTSIFGIPGYAGSTAESSLLRDLLAPGLGMTADQVPDLGALLVAPLARGATVSLGEPTAGGDGE